jgi:Rod binding domain-containing protein
MDGATAAIPVASAPASRTLELRRGEKAPKELAGLHQVAKGFDAIFADTMLGQLLAPVFGAGLGGSGPGASVVQGMVEQNLADAISKGGGFGVGRMIERSLGPRILAQMKKNAAAHPEGSGATQVEGGVR